MVDPDPEFYGKERRGNNVVKIKCSVWGPDLNPDPDPQGIFAWIRIQELWFQIRFQLKVK